MKTISKPYLLLFVTLALILAACASAEAAVPQTGEETQGAESIIDKCLSNSDEERLLVNMVHGYCVRYPACFLGAFMIGSHSICSLEDYKL